MWWKRNASCPASVDSVGPTSSRRARLSRLGRDLGAQRLRAEVLHRFQVEDLADHRAALQHRPLRGREPVQPGREQGADAGWHGEGAQVVARHPAAALAADEAVVDHHRDHLLDEERVALGRLDDPAPGPGRQRHLAEKVAHHLGALRLAQGAQRDGARPGRSSLQAGGARAARAGRCRGGAAPRPHRCRPGRRSGRGRWARPSGCPRSRPPPARSAPGPRAAGGRPRRSREPERRPRTAP